MHPTFGSGAAHLYNPGMSSALQETIDRLSKGGYRVTLPRRAVIEAIQGSKNSIDTAEVLRRARRRHARVGLATVYRTLDMLEEIGAIRRIQAEGRTRIVACADATLHFHLVCENCHGVIELHGEQEESLRRLARAQGFEPVNQPIEIAGRCANCQ
jgi:Fur family ferric uptake transcriptional regulator